MKGKIMGITCNELILEFGGGSTGYTFGGGSTGSIEGGGSTGFIK